jgi:hypothetical protein
MVMAGNSMSSEPASEPEPEGGDARPIRHATKEGEIRIIPTVDFRVKATVKRRLFADLFASFRAADLNAADKPCPLSLPNVVLWLRGQLTLNHAQKFTVHPNPLKEFLKRPHLAVLVGVNRVSPLLRQPNERSQLVTLVAQPNDLVKILDERIEHKSIRLRVMLRLLQLLVTSLIVFGVDGQEKFERTLDK